MSVFLTTLIFILYHKQSGVVKKVTGFSQKGIAFLYILCLNSIVTT